MFVKIPMCLKKLYGVKTTEKEDKRIETLEKWRENTIQQWSEVYTNDDSPSPYNTYFFEHCQYCSRFKPLNCFDQDGLVFRNTIEKCLKVKIGNAMLKKDFEEEYDTKEL